MKIANGEIRAWKTIKMTFSTCREKSGIVQVILTDNIPPTITITQPATDGFRVEEVKGKFPITLKGTAADSLSGVNRVEYSLDGVNFTPIVTGSPTNWQASINLLFRSNSQTISVRAVDQAGQVSAVSQRTVITVDKSDPKLIITVPENQIDLPGTDAAGAILPRLAGTASDRFSGVQKVEWALNPQPNSQYTLATPIYPGFWSAWSVQNIVIPGPAGPNKIKVRCFDKAGNKTEQELQVSVSLQYPPKDPTVQEYFSSLIDFIVRRVKVTSQNRPLQIDDLTTTFHQPFQRLLSGDATLYTQQVHQLRIVIEVLRLAFDKATANASGFYINLAKAVRGAGETSYRDKAYEILLQQIGTSVEEIRAARLADLQTRQALAHRLGFDLQPQQAVDPSEPRPDRLQQILLQPGQITDADLEELFGLIDFNRDPLQPPDSTPKLLDWQIQFLRTGWAVQDAAAAVPIVDPDVISEAYLRPRPNPFYYLWQNRRHWIDNQVNALREQLQAQPDLLTRFDQVVSSVVGPIQALLSLDVQYATGTNIEPELEQKQITLLAFVRLMKLRKLIAAGAVLDSEWNDVVSILVQVQKLRSFPDWQTEEQDAQLVLDPDFFQIPPLDRIDSSFPVWRVTPQSRQQWRDTLQARIDQEAAVQQAFLSVIDATEEQALPMLRTWLLYAFARISGDPSRLDESLLIDVKTSGYTKITRIAQAIQTLQELLVGLRTKHQLFDWSRDETKEDQADFDQELIWMGSYNTWSAAMQVFLFPENFLLPTLRPIPAQLPQAVEKELQTPAFQQLINDLRKNTPLTPEEARDLAQKYLDGLKSNYSARNFLLQPLFTKELLPSQPFQITEQYSQTELITLSKRIKDLIDLTTGTTNPPTTRLQNIPAYVRETFYFVPILLALQLQKSGQYLAALDWYRVVYAYDLPQPKIYYGLELERDTTSDPMLVYQRNIFWLKETLNPHEIVNESYDNPVSARYDAYTRFVVISLARCFLEFADAEFIQDTNESLPRARSLYVQTLALLNQPEINPPAVPGLSPNPVIANLKQRAQANLAKLRSGRNITGLKRQIESVPLIGQIGIPSISVGSGPFGTSVSRAFQPTQYRYSVLIERTKQLVTIAQQVEASFLLAVEKGEAEAYNLLKANQDLALSLAQVQLQNLRVIEADNSLELANRQKQRAEFQVSTLQGFLDAGMNQWERKLLEDYKDAQEARNWVAGLDAAISYAEALTQASSGGFLGTGIGFAHVPAMAVGYLSLAKGYAAIQVNDIEANIQEHSLRASVEHRIQEWNLQKGLAEKDIAINNQQILLAKDHQNIVNQERIIAVMQNSIAQATVEFLAGKFTNVELYEWMSGVLQEVYSYFLRQATGMAKLAQNQLAFERQEAMPLFIKNDYWQPLNDDSAFGSASGSASNRDRRGITGSARLLQDIYQLDQFAFETNKRKLQLAKTISLAEMVPLEFQRFRETGMLPFATPMKLFDRDFPGHYLRLIKRVRTSVVALIPPHQGIRATLTASGISRVVIGADVFQTISVQRDPESVALTSPSNATGLFELEAQSELLLPFEFMGVDTLWNLEMPKAANPFDYRTIADVLITIEYTALSSLDYRQYVVQQLDRTVTVDRSYSFRNQFADQWYDLNNPDQAATPMTISFTTMQEDFPANIEKLTIKQIALYIVSANQTIGMTVQAKLLYSPLGVTQPAIGGEATTTPDGIISTRLGNASSWIPMLNQSPIGKWQLAFPDTSEIRNLFKNEAIADILFAITYSGQTPEWPV
jgi:Tc toxin complex TcA C-terminal TcB-binding domain/Bacterial Ig domain